MTDDTVRTTSATSEEPRLGTLLADIAAAVGGVELDVTRAQDDSDPPDLSGTRPMVASGRSWTQRP